ncbi:ubiquitinyl hydrolase 1 [Theileria orientalis]|uniref:ubiquitinyl hydrolase 1 n=1 Tax=Theileria orientalis TaxID=68886 RepID=A0A976M9E0_THEOR|nr:ubiquitinyl hydrolase 1 [Theileria orientalis]
MNPLSDKFDQLCKELSLKVPNSHSVVHKTECIYSIDNEYFPDGIFINLSSFESFGKEMLKYDKNYPKAIYLNVKRYLEPVFQEEPEETQQDDVVYKERKYYEEVTEYEVFSPSLGSIKLDESPGNLLNICNAIIEHAGYEFKSGDLAWMNMIEESKYARDLVQIENPPQISHNNLKCQKCGSTTNLWLNLSDGFVGCGRKNYDSGGCQDGSEGAALLHYQETGCKYHLAVKLGTITPTSADVFSYAPDEDNLVTDPLLDKHLSHFGIKIQLLEKTEKTTLQLELEKNQSHSWTDVVTDNDSIMKPAPKFVGIDNSGHNCYINSIVQFLNNVPEMNSYFIHYYNQFNAMDFDDVLLQYSKICTCINTNKFVTQCNFNLSKYQTKCKERNIEYFDITSHKSFHVNPNMFKYSLSKHNKLFDNNDQQDAEEFLSFFIDYLNEHVDKKDNELDLKKLFYFNVHQVVKCDALKLINVNTTETHILSLSLLNSLTATSDNEVDSTEELLLTDPINNWYNKVPIEYLNDGVTHPATLENGLNNLPKYLFIKLERFYMKKDWTFSKLVNPVMVPDVVTFKLYDKSSVNVEGYQVVYNDKDSRKGTSKLFYDMDEGLLNVLLSMGFTDYQVRRAYFATKSNDVDTCLNWILSNELNDTTETLLLLNQLGYNDNELNLKLLGYYGDDISSLIDYLSTTSSNGNEDVKTGATGSNTNADYGTDNSYYNNDLGNSSTGDSEVGYQLVGFVTHVGNSINSGHYICHLKKDDDWYAFNDSKINKCANVPVQNGYIYLFQRL